MFKEKGRDVSIQEIPHPNHIGSPIRISKICGTNNSMYFAEPQSDINYGHPKKFFKLDKYFEEDRQRLTQYRHNISQDEQFQKSIYVSSYLAWFMLILNTLFSSLVPCWLMGGVKAQFFTRNSWRFTTVSILLIPFMMFEQRNIKEENDKFINCLTKDKLKPIFISSINICIWIFFIVYACRWTSINHAICLSDLKLLIISLLKFRDGKKFHQFQVGGAMITILGIFLMLTDSVTIPQITNPQIQTSYYVRVEPWKRLLIGDGLAIMGSFASYYLDRYFVRPSMPRFTYLFIFNLFLSFNLISFGYFFGGSQFSFDIKYGVFGLYTYQNFVSVFYVSIILGLTMILTNIFVRQIFSELIINVTSRFEVVFSSIFYHLLRIQRVPSGLTCLGYSFLVPGLVFILGGQAVLENKQIFLNLRIYQEQQKKNEYQKLQQKLVIEPHTPNVVQQSQVPKPPKSPEKKTMPFLQILQEQEETLNQNYDNQEEYSDGQYQYIDRRDSRRNQRASRFSLND